MPCSLPITPRRLAAALLTLPVGLGAVLASAQTAPLNDTGQAQCYNAANAAAPCDEATTGNAKGEAPQTRNTKNQTLK